ncbi:glycine betaine ABC transporter substrate-binding protein, partial [Chloroflexota bacterium]
MQKRKSNWMRALMVLTALLIAVSIFGGCASEPEKKMDITMADSQFDSLWFNNAVAEYILEKGYGYNVETIETTTPIAQVSLAEGDMDIWMEMWQQNWQDH